MPKVHLKDVRLSYVKVFEPEQVNGQGDPKFSCAGLFTREHPQLAELQQAVIDAATEKWGAKAMEVLGQLKAADRLPVHDGDSKPGSDGYAGNLFLNASNKMRPLTVGKKKEILSAADGKPYSGCYGNLIVEIWAQDNKFGKRVNASLLGVQFTKDGDRLAGGSVAAADDFDEIPDDAKTAAAATGKGAAGLF